MEKYTNLKACVAKFFKHLIHVFVCIILISFAMMLIMVVETQKTSPELDSAWTMHVQSITNYLNDNAVYYGLAKVGESVGFQDGLDKYFRNQFPSIKDKQNKVKELAKFSEGSMVHPLYVEM